MQCKSAEVSGDVHIGEGVIIHPGARIVAGEGGSVTLGRGCVVEERCLIEALPGSRVDVGEGNLFQVGCRVRALSVGDFNVFGAKVRSRACGSHSRDW